jgi:glycosyltransferase involved in cell wall biosynthesis
VAPDAALTGAGTTASVRISVVVPTYGRRLALGRCLASLAAQRFPRREFEVVVVDDGGDPPAGLGIGRDGPSGFRVTVLREPHGGPGAARMAGIRVARGELLALLDDDCTVPPDYLAQVARAFAVHPDLRVAQVRLENPEPGNLYGVAWKVALDETLRLNVEIQPGGPARCGILGGVIACRREIFAEVGYDPALPGGREDADLRFQLEARGIPVHYVPDIVVWNHCRRRFRDFVAQHVGYGRSELELWRKWGTDAPPARYPRLLAWRSLCDLVARHGLARGAAVYGLFWVKRYSGRAGLAAGAIAGERPAEGRALWARVALRLARAEARFVLGRVRGTLGRAVRRVGRAGPPAPGRDGGG